MLSLVLAASSFSVPAASTTGCDCGSTDPSAPCTGNAASLSYAGTTVRYKGGSPESLSAQTITFSFACGGAPCACGRFASGDYWVAPETPSASVTVSSVTPDAPNNGLIANPSGADHGQGLLPCAHNVYKAELNHAQSLPKDFPGGTSLVKSVVDTDHTTWMHCEKGSGGAEPNSAWCRSRDLPTC